MAFSHTSVIIANPRAPFSKFGVLPAAFPAMHERQLEPDVGSRQTLATKIQIRLPAATALTTPMN
jgi:hypothetical protein